MGASSVSLLLGAAKLQSALGADNPLYTPLPQLSYAVGAPAVVSIVGLAYELLLPVSAPMINVDYSHSICAYTWTPESLDLDDTEVHGFVQATTCVQVWPGNDFLLRAALFHSPPWTPLGSLRGQLKKLPQIACSAERECG